MLTRCLARELSTRGIRVNSVAPGSTRSRIAHDAFERFPEVIPPIAAQTALGRLGEADDIGKVIAAVLSDEFARVTGENIEASGGFRMRPPVSRRITTSCHRPASRPTAVPRAVNTGVSHRRLLRAVTSEEGHRVTTLELYFDLAFVFAFTQVSRLMAHRHDALGVLQALVVLALLWWSWTAYGWLANRVHADEGVVRVAMIVAMAAVFIAGLAVPETYDDLDGGMFAPLVLVGAYLVARITHAVVFTAVEDAALRRQVVVTEGLSLIPSGALLVIGALLGSPWQVWCWVAAITIEPLLAYVTSWGVDWRVHSAAHFTERYGLVVILALGESLSAIGVGVATEPISVPNLIGVVLAIVISVGMWWAYFSRLAGLAEHALAHLHGARRARAATDGYTYLHLGLVAGIVFAALGVEDAMAHIGELEPFGLFGAAALGGGVACYLAGTGFFARGVTGEWPVQRLAGAMLLLAAVPVLALLAPIAALAIVAGLLLALLVIEHLAGQPTTPGAAAGVAPRRS